MVTGSISMSKEQIDHDFQSAKAQSGIAAGSGGFDIAVAGNTDLHGAAITSSAERDKNKLSTGSLSYSDLTNTQTTRAESESVSVGYGGAGVVATIATNVVGNVLANEMGERGLPENITQTSTTQSVISPANITITGNDAQSTENVAALTRRDASTANQSLTNQLTLQQAQELKAQQQEAQANQIAANYVGAVITNVIGDVAQVQGWPDGGWQKTALHGMAGLIQAKVAGTDPGKAMMAAMLNEQMLPVLENYLISQGITLTNEKTRAEYVTLMQAASTLLGAAFDAASVTYTATINNYLKHAEAQQLGKLKDAQMRGRCDAACEQEIKDLEALDLKRDQTLAACEGVNSTACSGVRQEVRDAAAEYIRVNHHSLDSRYARESGETQSLARGTTDGVAGGVIKGASQSLIDTANGVASAAKTAFAALMGDPEAKQDIQRAAGAMADYVANPDNWPYLLGAMTPETREQLAQAYEKGDGAGIGQLMGTQALELLSNAPMAGGAGIIKKVDKAAEVTKASEAAQKAVAKLTGNTPVDIAHTIGADYNPRTGKVTGGHTLLNGDVRVAQMVSPPDAKGVYEAKVEMKAPDGTWISKTSNNGANTMFPQHWDSAKVQAEIEWAWKNRMPHIDGTPSKWQGVSSSGVKIEGFESPRATAYPVYGGKK